jgi:bifunctional non-homologous end joining protein LigD
MRASVQKHTKSVKSDSAIKPARLPDFVEPMQAMLVDSIRPGVWIYEVKFDGYRAVALRGGSQTRVLFRNEKDLAANSLCPF